ncbi:transglycosylase domain-containing protein [Sporichthya polymorpha]|uniref:transglycosylase domain-containing protein n=1 Tax=Sporichthya polymorpha TaxID=35751 RepID=UPI0003687666|nr:transglycosylase domain-containing protein [Sporichthya polymorpha]
MKFPWGRRKNKADTPVVITPALGTWGAPKEEAKSAYIAGFLGACVLAGAMVAGMLLPLVGTGAVAAKKLAEDFQELPSDIETRPPAQASVVLAADGTRIATFYDENRVAVPLAKVAPIMIKAILAIEDSRFYEHGGVDPKGTLRALVNNQGGEGGRQGGSTLTQQYVKNLLIQLSDGDPDKIAAARAPTIKRKVQELKYALEIEKRMTKDQILENYLNISYFGSGAYGIEAAARRYFSKSSNNLTLTEAAMLAGAVQSPGRYDATQYPEAAQTRRDVVLTRMRDVGYITTDQMSKAKAEDLGLRVSPTFNGCTRSPVPFFCDYITKVILNDPIFGETERDRSDVLSRGGLTIRTTLNMQAQKAADESMKFHTNPTDKVAASLATVEPGTGKILAMTNSREYGTGKGKTVINYATDYKYGGSRGFQNGSTHKVFTSAAAIAEGYGTEYKIDSPFRKGGFPHQMRCDGKRVPADGWSPKNFTDEDTNGIFGKITQREALRRSVNTYYASLEVRVGLCDVVKMAEAAGIHRADGQPQFEFLPYTLGINEISPLTLANSYATFAARGKRCDPIAIESIAGRDGKALPVPSANCQQTIKPEVADVVADLLRSVMEKGGYGFRMRLSDNNPCLLKNPVECIAGDPNSDRAAGGKTGTTNNQIAVWYAGMTMQMSTAVWVGNPDDYGFTMDDISIGGFYRSAVSGSRVPGPIWRDMMIPAHKGLPKLNFHPPSNKWLRGTKGAGEVGPGRMTYKAGELNTPKAGDPIPAAKPNNNQNQNQNNNRNNNQNNNRQNNQQSDQPANPNRQQN